MKAERDRVQENSLDFSIRVQDITKIYPATDGAPQKHALKGVSFGVTTNNCLGILGHNGAGKVCKISS